jgi:hypothetical protein
MGFGSISTFSPVVGSTFAHEAKRTTTKNHFIEEIIDLINFKFF